MALSTDFGGLSRLVSMDGMVAIVRLLRGLVLAPNGLLYARSMKRRTSERQTYGRFVSRAL